MSQVVTGTAEASVATPSASICPVCGSETHRKLPAHFAGFAAERTGLSGPAETHFCTKCEHVYLTPFYTDDHIASIYRGYRNEEYNLQRERHEPGYLALAPNLSDPASAGHQIRREYYTMFLSQWYDFKGVVVDYGGGDGYFSKFVFREAEVIVVEEDFERRGGDLDELLSRAGFLFATHVFEHLPQPLKALSRLTSQLRPNVPVYMELPKTYAGRLSSAFGALERSYELGEPLPWVDIAVLHEHLAHFSKSSAQTLMERASVPCEEFYYHAANLMGFLGRKRAD